MRAFTTLIKCSDVTMILELVTESFVPIVLPQLIFQGEQT